jgi:predicted MFS family arabinose efflux permease
LILSIAQIGKLYKDSYSGHAKEVWYFTILTLINRIGTMVIPFLTIYLTIILGFSLKEAGILAGAFGGGGFVGAYFGGKLSDKYEPEKVITGSLFISGLFLISLQYFTDFYTLLVMIFLTAAFGESYRPAVMAAVAKYITKRETARTVALLRLAINLGMSAGPAAGGFLAASGGYHLLFWINGLTCIAASFYCIYISGKGKKKIPPEGVQFDSVGDESKKNIPPYKDKYYVWFLLSSLIVGFSFVQWFQSVPVFIKSIWLFDERYIGMLMAMNGLTVALFEMPIAHYMEKRNRDKAALLIGIGLIGISFLAFLIPPFYLLGFIGMMLLTVGELFYLPFNNSIPLKMSPWSRRGEYMAWYWMAWSMSMILGPTLGLAIIDGYGFAFFWMLSFVLLGVGFLITSRIYNKLV